MKLADFYNVQMVMALCERHLLCCVEIPLIDRFLLAEKYKFIGVKVHHSLPLDINLSFHEIIITNSYIKNN